MHKALERRKLVRSSSDSAVTLRWRDDTGELLTENATVIDLSDGGMAFRSAQPVQIASCLIVRCPRAGIVALAQVRHCSWNHSSYRVGVRYVLKARLNPAEDGGRADYHDFLRDAASPGPVHCDGTERLYRALSFRYHPDNRDTGDSETFLAVREIYRIAFATRHSVEFRVSEPPAPSKDFQSMRGESRREAERRIHVLSLLYQRRMTDCEDAGLSAHDIAAITGTPPRELNFSLWYLREKGLVTATDSSIYAISVNGVDLFETLSCEHDRAVTDAQPARRP